MIDPEDIALIKRQIEAQIAEYEKAVCEAEKYWKEYKSRQRPPQRDREPAE